MIDIEMTRPMKVFINRKIPIDLIKHKGYRLCLVLIESKYWRARIMYDDIEHFAIHLVAGMTLMDLTRSCDKDINLGDEVKAYVCRQVYPNQVIVDDSFYSNFLKDSYNIINTYELLNG
jgi:hypothetical protein